MAASAKTIEAKKAELVAVCEKIRAHEADFDARRKLLSFLVDAGVTKAELARLAGTTAMAINYALNDPRKKK